MTGLWSCARRKLCASNQQRFLMELLPAGRYWFLVSSTRMKILHLHIMTLNTNWGIVVP
jgi:hypothetical protein